MSDHIDELKEAEKEELRIAEQETKSVSVGKNITGGLVLIGVGTIFLLSNVTGFFLENWWALFILIPAVASFSSAAEGYRRHGGWTNESRGPLVGGIILSLVAGTFLFGISWSLVWPMFLIIGGIAAILNR